MEVVIHEIATDGLPDMNALVGRVAFIFDGCVVSGWPYEREPDDIDYPYDGILWVGNEDVSHGGPFAGVTHWIEWPVPVWEISK